MFEREVRPPLRRQDARTMSSKIAPPALRDAESWAKEHESLEKLWKDILRQLVSGHSEGTHIHRALPLADAKSPHRGIDLINAWDETGASEQSLDPTTTPDDCYRCRGRRSAWRDYVDGAALAFNPFGYSSRPYTYASDVMAMASDWDAVRSDMVEAWAALIEEDPKFKELVKSVLGERANGEPSGSERP